MSLAIGSTIVAVLGRRVWDSRGRPTIEAEVHLSDGSRGRGIVASGASRGRYEAVELRDGGEAFGGFGVARALANLRGPIAAALRGRDAADQPGVDAALQAVDGSPTLGAMGANATLAASLATLQAAAASQGLPLYRLLGQGPVCLPLPQVQIFGGGAHAGRRVDIQDFLIMPVEADSFDHAMAMCAEVYRRAGEWMRERGMTAGVADEGGWWPQFASNEAALGALEQSIDRAGFGHGQVRIAVDVAASQLADGDGYRLALEDRRFDRDAWLELLLRWVRRFGIVSIEDPCSEDDAAGMRAFTAAIGDAVQVVGDDFLVTNAARIREAAATGACNAALLKPNQSGTITGTAEALAAARASGFGTVVSARSGETEDTAIAHLAVGWNAGQLKVGSFSRSERMAKWNELLRIEEELGAQARYAGGAALGFQARSAGRDAAAPPRPPREAGR